MRLDVVTPEGLKVAASDVAEVVLPGVLGEMGILPGHVALMAALGTGPMRVSTASGTTLYAVSGGYVEVLGDVVRVLTETCERYDEIDTDYARAKLEQASKKLAELAPADGEAYQVALLSYKKAETRLRVAELGKASSG